MFIDIHLHDTATVDGCERSGHVAVTDHRSRHSAVTLSEVLASLHDHCPTEYHRGLAGHGFCCWCARDAHARVPAQAPDPDRRWHVGLRRLRDDAQPARRMGQAVSLLVAATRRRGRAS